MTGRCKLCLRDGVELRTSHLMPKGLYRLFRTDGSGRNPNPWIASPEGEVQTSRQETAHMFCPDCELRFSRNGELWVLRNTMKRDGSFRLASMLSEHTPFVTEASLRMFHASQVPKVNVPAISYFAASMFWRASVWPWKPSTVRHVRLGPFEEAFRRYLLQEASWPDCASLMVVVREKSKVSFLSHDPVRSKQTGIHAFTFPMPGLSFTLFVSRHLDDFHSAMCFVRGEGHPIGMGSAFEPLYEENARKLFVQHQRGFTLPLSRGARK